MKKLQKIKLINWYTFQNQTIEINGNVLVSGINGSGKSTLLDAIQYVLTAGRQKFNQAANENSKRTLETYVRCKLNVENKKYLREGDVTSYIALEFENDDMTRKDIIGVVIEVTQFSKLNRTFFKMSNIDLEDSLFIEDNAPKTLWNFKRTKNINIDFFDTKSEIQNMICSVLGLSGNKYFELLAKAISFKPINDLNDFVNNFLLPEKNVSVDNLRQNVEELRELLDIIELEEDKVQLLEKIESQYDEFCIKENELDKNKWLKKNIEIEKIKQEIDKLENEDSINELKISELIKEKENCLHELSTLEDLTKKYRDSQKDNKEAMLYYELDDKLKKIESDKEQSTVLFRNYKRNLEKEKNNLRSFDWTRELNNVTFADTSYLKEILVKINNNCNVHRNELGLLKFELEKRKEKVNEKFNIVNSKLEKLRIKKLPYEDNVINLQNSIKEYLFDRYNKNIEVRPVCEYIDITDEKWRNAIEGYLNNQRFDLIIEPQYFDEALKVYEEVKGEKKIYGVGLVNTQKLEDLEVVPNTLAEHIVSDNIYAKRYVVNLLNKVVCCDKLEELKNHKQSITSTCMTYRNHVARQINPKVYEDYFIGKNASSQQLEKYQNAYDEIVKSKNEIINNQNDVESQYNKLNNSNISNLIQEIYIVDRYNKVCKDYEDIKKKIDDLKVEGIINNVKEQIEKFEKEAKRLQGIISQKSNEIVKLELIIADNQKNILEKQNYLSLNTLELNLNDDWQNELNDIVKKNLENSLNVIEKKIQEISDNINKMENSIVILLCQYNERFEYDEVPSIDNIKSYLLELSKIRQQDLIRHKSSVLQFKEQCQISFREDFISQIKDKILSTQEDIKKLNMSLKKQKFGKEKYEFICKKSDNPEMAMYYDIIVSGNNYGIHNLFEDNLTAKQQDIMDELFNKLTISHTKDNADRVIEEYTDYRKYMSYDIKVTNEEGDYYYFSTSLKEKSGGEIQTPFYVIIASSFEQLLKNARREDSVGCLVIFDEAFNNMDESRINAMMKFYSNLNIQLMIAVPPERIPNIAPYANTTLIVNRQKNTSYVQRFVLDEEVTNE